MRGLNTKLIGFIFKTNYIMVQFLHVNYINIILMYMITAYVNHVIMTNLL